jgi:TRAP-type transport system periplasmic protein
MSRLRVEHARPAGCKREKPALRHRAGHAAESINKHQDREGNAMLKARMFAGSLAAAALMGAATAASAQTLIVTTNVPPVHWASTKGGEPFMACVKQATGGKLDFNYFPSGQLANFFQSLDAVNKGIAHISYIVVSAQTDKLPLNNISLLPDMGETVVEMTNAYRKALNANGLMAQEYAQNRIRPLLINMFPQYQMHSRGEPMDSLAKLSAKKISTGGGALMVTLSSVGANAIELPPTDLYLAIQNGTIDGTMLALASIKPYKLQEVVKSMSANGSFGSAAGVWSIDLATWDKLAPDHQKALTECGLKVENDLAKWVDDWTEELKKEFAAAGVKVFNYSPAEKVAIGLRLKGSTEDYLKRVAGRGLPAQKAYEEYLKALGR